jgi:phage shock protein PspC (stress-responsive transcriptional regulator)
MEILKKLTSRKMWAAVAGLVAGLGMAFGLDEGIISTVAGAVVALSSVITYIVTEGKIDAEGVKVAVEKTQTAVEVLNSGDGK